MIPCICLVQAGQISEQSETVLRSKLDAFTQKTFGEGAQISWVAVSKGNGFTAAKPSSSSIVSVRPHTPVAQQKRAELLHELCGFWTAETGQSMNEIVGVIADPIAS
ncbi:MAG: hypothetical protein AAGL90_13635 [Pseudomonadota bacterium]